MSFWTAFTPGIVQASASARVFSAGEGVKPDSCTTPLRVSTPMAVMRTDRSSACLALMFAVMEASSMKRAAAERGAWRSPWAAVAA